MTGLMLNQEDIRLFIWKGQSKVITGYYTYRESNYMSS